MSSPRATAAQPMKRKGATKRQHYVPRLILRNFSSDLRRRAISLVVLDGGQRIDDSSISTQCCADYFYGADQAIEDSFALEEGVIAGHFGDLSREHLDSLDDEALCDLRLFVHYQRARTAGAAEDASNQVEAFAKSILRKTFVGHPEIKPEDVDLVRIRLKHAQHASLAQAASCVPIIFDLNVKFIFTARSPGFVLSDNPVVAYNQFAEHHPRFRHYRGNHGLAMKGLQFFLPISPNVTIAVFDPCTYQYGSTSTRNCTAGPSDVDYLNRMQFINARSCVYFAQDRLDGATMADLLLARSLHPTISSKVVAQSPMISVGAGKHGQLVAVSPTDMRVGAKLSFIRPMDGHSYENYNGPTIPIRSAELFRLSELYRDMVQKKADERRSTGRHENDSRGRGDAESV